MLSDILQKLYTIEHIPTHPVIKKKLENILSEFNSGGKERQSGLIKYLSYDPCITLELLKIANSDSLGLRNKISSIENALLILDKDLIELIIAQHPVISGLEFYQKLNDEYLKLVKHSIEVCSFTELILKEIPLNIIPEDKRSEILTASILHDMGLIFLLIYFPDHYAELISYIKMSKTIQRKSKRSFIADHSLFGSLLCGYWQLPDDIIKSIAFHHYPWTGDNADQPGAEILYIADSISESFYKLYYDDNDVYTVDEHIIMRRNMLDILEKLEIDIVKIAEIRMRAGIMSENLYSDLDLNTEANSLSQPVC